MNDARLAFAVTLAALLVFMAVVTVAVASRLLILAESLRQAVR
jgi:hypothetical protein